MAEPQQSPNTSDAVEQHQSPSAADQPQPAQPQPLPQGELTPANASEDKPQATNSASMGEFGTQVAPMTKEEALKMLQAVRDRDMLRRLRHEQIERNQHVPTDRDW